MSELKAYLCIQAREIENKTFSCYNQTLAVKNVPEATMAQVYLKSEADKVIADLEESHKMEVGQLLIEIAELKEELKNSRNARKYWRKEYLIEYKECCSQKFKRCLAMAAMCAKEVEYLEGLVYGVEGAFEKYTLYKKWHQRWLELAEKFTDKE